MLTYTQDHSAKRRGHANTLNPAPADAVQILDKEYLRIIHVHDNMGTEDNHLDPFDRTVDRDEFSLSLKDIGFYGVLSLEINM